MAKVKIQGHASGTGILTVTAPNTSTDRTVTLPDVTGTLLTTTGDGSQLTGISSGPTHTSSGTAPSSPSIGDFWMDTTNDRLYIRTNDGTSNIWLQI